MSGYDDEKFSYLMHNRGVSDQEAPVAAKYITSVETISTPTAI
jgi:hypothetical protein